MLFWQLHFVAVSGRPAAPCMLKVIAGDSDTTPTVHACQLAATLHFTSWYNFASWQKFLVSPAGKIIPAGLTFTSWQLSEII